MLKVGFYWFCNDLRLLDNLMLLKAATEFDKFLRVYCFDPLWLLPNRYGLVSMSVNRVSFLKESLIELDKQLHELGQHLLVCNENPVNAIKNLAIEHKVSTIYRSCQIGYYENHQWLATRNQLSSVNFVQTDTLRLYEQGQLTFRPLELPNTFTKFKKQLSI